MVQGKRVDVVDRHPSQLEALGVGDDGVERVRHAGHQGRVPPEAEFEHTREQGGNGVGGHACLLGRLAQRADGWQLTFVQRPARNAPGSPVVAPLGAVLQEDAALRVDGNKSCGPEPAPVALPGLRVHPGVPRIARPMQASGHLAARGGSRHPASFTRRRHPAKGPGPWT